MLKKLTVVATSLALAFTIAACGKKRANVKLTGAQNPMDSRLLVFQGDWETDSCYTLNDGGFGKEEIYIYADLSQFANTKFDNMCGAAGDVYYGDEVAIKATSNTTAEIVDEFGLTHKLSISNGQITDTSTGRTYIKKN